MQITAWGEKSWLCGSKLSDEYVKEIHFDE